jgi:hypothetical protein
MARRRRPAARARRAGWSGPQRLDRAARIRWTATAVWARSPRCLGNSTPRLTSPTWWPARPTRWRRWPRSAGLDLDHQVDRAHVDAELEAAGRHDAGQRPRLRSSSMSARCSLDTEPWWALAMTGAAPCSAGLRHHSRGRVPLGPTSTGRVGGDLVQPGGQPLGQRAELANTMVERCCSIRSATCSSTCGQMARAPAWSPRPRRSLVGRSCPRRDDDAEVPLLARRGATISTGRAAEEPRDLLERRTVADSPMRWAGRRAARRGARG